MAQLFAGTSGFAYPAWKPGFYPAKLPQKKFLEHYASRLNAVEINYTFRRMPAAATLTGWAGATPSGFQFALKAHQRITHFQELGDAAEFTAAFLDALAPLRAAGRLGPVLFQLPPHAACDLSRLRQCLAALPRGLRCAFEFRHESWLTEPVYRLLSEHNAALCVAESERLTIPEVVTADFIYFRLRRPDYTPEELATLRRHSQDLIAQGKDVFAFFKHEDDPSGALHAEQLLSPPAQAAAG